jgi:hypothetical protein
MSKKSTPVEEIQVEDYLYEHYGQKSVVVVPLRIGKDKERMEDLILFNRLIDNLWEVYWVGSNAKVTKKLFNEASLISFRYMSLITNTNFLTDSIKIWATFKEKFSLKALMALKKCSNKMNEKQRLQTKEIHTQIVKIYNKY